MERRRSRLLDLVGLLLITWGTLSLVNNDKGFEEEYEIGDKTYLFARKDINGDGKKEMVSRVVDVKTGKIRVDGFEKNVGGDTQYSLEIDMVKGGVEYKVHR
jgi:hypothetical protein